MHKYLLFYHAKNMKRRLLAASVIQLLKLVDCSQMVRVWYQSLCVINSYSQFTSNVNCINGVIQQSYLEVKDSQTTI